MDKKIKVGIILGSSREGRVSPSIGDWTLSLAQKNMEADFEIIDVIDYNLPFLGESKDQGPATKWNDKIESLDGFIFITPEYNHSITGSLKNAIDHAYDNWFNKAAGIISYGFGGGARAAEHLRGILGAIAVADVQTHPMLSMVTDFKDKKFSPNPYNDKVVSKMVDEVVNWSKALKTIRK
jgi:NAD(P)H-dependent FMN reductase